VPYHSLQNLQVLHQLVQGKHPERPSTTSISDEHWEFMVWCWADQGKLRPRIEDICRYVSTYCKAERIRSHT
jgi:hypothetical protein